MHVNPNISLYYFFILNGYQIKKEVLIKYLHDAWQLSLLSFQNYKNLFYESTYVMRLTVVPYKFGY